MPYDNNYYLDKTVLVTGGASGIGRELCLQLASKGADIIIGDVNKQLTDTLLAEINSEGTKAEGVYLNVTDYNMFGKTIEDVSVSHNGIDIIFNNAGVACAGEVRDLSIDQWNKVIGINLQGVINGTVAAYKKMCEQGYGQIVNIASMAGLTAFPISVPYGTSKFGVVGLTRSLKLEAEDLGIKVNLVCPGYIDTPLLSKTEIVNADRNAFLSKIPFKLISVDKAVGIILKGVERNKSEIIFPRYARVLNKLGHFFPQLLERQLIRSVALFRSIRKNPGE